MENLVELVHDLDVAIVDDIPSLCWACPELETSLPDWLIAPDGLGVLRAASENNALLADAEEQTVRHEPRKERAHATEIARPECFLWAVKWLPPGRDPAIRCIGNTLPSQDVFDGGAFQFTIQTEPIVLDAGVTPTEMLGLPPHSMETSVARAVSFTHSMIVERGMLAIITRMASPRGISERDGVPRSMSRKRGSLTVLQEQLIQIRASESCHAQYTIRQLASGSIPRHLIADILVRIACVCL